MSVDLAWNAVCQLQNTLNFKFLFLLISVELSRVCFKFKSTPWCSGYSVRFAVGRPGVHSPSRVIAKDFKRWYPQLSCLALGILGGLWRTSRQVRLLCPWARHLTVRPRLHVEDRWPKHLKNGNSQASANVPSEIERYNSISCEWRINMAKKKKPINWSTAWRWPRSLRRVIISESYCRDFWFWKVFSS